MLSGRITESTVDNSRIRDAWPRLDIHLAELLPECSSRA